MILKNKTSIYSAVLLSFCSILILQSNVANAVSLSVGTRGVQLSHDFPINEKSNFQYSKNKHKIIHYINMQHFDKLKLDIDLL